VSASRKLRRRVIRAVFFVTVCAVLYLALMPNNGHSRFRIVPLPMYRWLEATRHDDLGNIVAFGFLALITFLVHADPAGRKNPAGTDFFASRFAGRTARLAGLLAMVCVFESLQRWIPGRTSSLQDVCTGWSGIFAAWLLSVLLDARQKSSGAGVSEN
jgi:hypothetical protein